MTAMRPLKIYKDVLMVTNNRELAHVIAKPFDGVCNRYLGLGEVAAKTVAILSGYITFIAALFKFFIDISLIFTVRRKRIFRVGLGKAVEWYLRAMKCKEHI